jgi:hypothetical protein
MTPYIILILVVQEKEPFLARLLSQNCPLEQFVGPLRAVALRFPSNGQFGINKKDAARMRYAL